MTAQLAWLADISGASRPWKVVDEGDHDPDGFGREYIVKHFREGDETRRLAEYVCGSVAAQLDATTPAPLLLRFTSAFLADLRRNRKQPRGLDEAQPGVHVAYRWLHNVAPFVMRPDGRDRLAHPHQIGDIIGCDALVQNWDRTDQNILVEPLSVRGKSAHVLHAIDWDYGMAGASVSPGALNGLKDVPNLLKPFANPLFDIVTSCTDFEHFCALLENWKPVRARAQMIANGVPTSWGFAPLEIDSVVTYLVHRFQSTLDRLAMTDDPDGAFPNWQFASGI
jgi:hypothetical protein